MNLWWIIWRGKVYRAEGGPEVVWLRCSDGETLAGLWDPERFTLALDPSSIPAGRLNDPGSTKARIIANGEQRASKRSTDPEPPRRTIRVTCSRVDLPTPRTPEGAALVRAINQAVARRP